MDNRIHVNFNHHTRLGQSGLNPCQDRFDPLENFAVGADKAPCVTQIREVGTGAHHMAHLCPHSAQRLFYAPKDIQRLRIAVTGRVELATGFNRCRACHINKGAHPFGPTIRAHFFKPATATGFTNAHLLLQPFSYGLCRRMQVLQFSL